MSLRRVFADSAETFAGQYATMRVISPTEVEISTPSRLDLKTLVGCAETRNVDTYLGLEVAP